VNTSPRPKSVALIFLLGAFLTGGAVGYAATKTFDSPKPIPQFTSAQMRTEIKRKLQLTPEQITQFDAHYDARRAVLDSLRTLYQPAMDSIRAIFQPKIDSVRANNQENVMQILDASQKDTYSKMIADDKHRADSTKKANAK